MIFTQSTKATTEVLEANEPISLSQAKLWLKIEDDVTEDDELIKALIASSRLECEQQTGLCIARRTIVDRMTNWPEYDSQKNPNASFYLLRYPVDSINSITYRKSNEEDDTTIEATEYNLHAGKLLAKVSTLPGKTWPEVDGREGGISISYSAGWSSVSEMPQDLVTAMKLMLTAHYQKRSDSVSRFRSAAMNIINKHYIPVI